MTDRRDPRDPFPPLRQREPISAEDIAELGDIILRGSIRALFDPNNAGGRGWLVEADGSATFLGQVNVGSNVVPQIMFIRANQAHLNLVEVDAVTTDVFSVDVAGGVMRLGFEDLLAPGYVGAITIAQDGTVSFPNGIGAAATPWTLGEQFWTLGNGTKEGNFVQLGSMVIATGKIVLGSTSTVSAGFSTSFPVAPHAFYDSANNSPVGIATYVDASGNTYHGRMIWSSATRARFSVDDVTGTYAVRAVCSDTVPFTWTTSDQAWFTLIYLAAV